MSYCIVWEFEVAETRCAAFEAAYGPEGPWAQLFRKSDEFLEVKLLQCLERAGTYFTVDRWVSEPAFRSFQQDFAAEYGELDRRLDGIASRETLIGAFVEIG